MEHLDVLIVGAGLSGIGAAHYLQTKSPWASYAVFEARDAIGGTWDLFRYPGVRSDSDMYTLGYSFRPWNGEKAIADGASILQYIKDTAAEEGIDKHIRFRHRIVAADWSSADALWTVTFEDGDSGETATLTANFLFSCTGYYRYDHGYQPQWPGMDEFQGDLIYPQAWPEDLDYTGKKVVVIGSGATAVTLIPSMADKAEHVTMLQRSPTYIASVPAKSPLAAIFKKVLPKKQAALLVRWIMAIGTQGTYQLSKRYPKVVKKFLLKGVAAQLPAGYDVATHFTPSYNPWDQRLCAVPDGDLFKVISAGKASVVTDHIASFTKTGILLEAGPELEADVIVSATGLEVLFMGGMVLTVDGEAIDIPNRFVYRGMMLEGVPNVAFAIGYTNASWTLKCDLTCDYVTRLLNRMQETGTRQCVAVNSDPTLSEQALMGLNSGYLNRAADRMPKQGSRFPWRVHQNFVADYRTMKLRKIDDDAMTFSNPVPTTTKAVA